LDELGEEVEDLLFGGLGVGLADEGELQGAVAGAALSGQGAKLGRSPDKKQGTK
jgi:hypothetical protein